MASIVKDFNILGGEDWPFRFVILDQYKVPKNLTNATSSFVMKRNAEDKIEVLRRSGIPVLPYSSGIIDVPITVADTIGLLGNYFYEFQITVAGVRRKVANGVITVKPTVIRDGEITTIPANYFGMHIFNPTLTVPVPYSVARATGRSWIHLEGDGIIDTVNTGIPGIFDWGGLDDQVTAAAANSKRIMYTSEKIPTFATHLAAAITDTVNPKVITIDLGAAGTMGFIAAVGMRLKVDNEYLTITSALTVLSGGTTGTLTVTRASDGTVAATHSSGTKVVLAYYYDFPPAANLLAWAAANPGDPYGLPLNTGPTNARGLTAWALFCKTLVQRFAGKMEAYELYNEPEQTWSGTVPEIVTFTGVYHDAVRQYDPLALVISPACQTISWMDLFWGAGGTRDIDAISFHGYPLLAAPVAETLNDRKIAPLKVIIAKYGLSKKPIWDTEASWGEFVNLSSTNAQKAFLAIYYLLHWSLGIVRYYWYSWDDTTDLDPAHGNPDGLGFGALYDTVTHAVTAASSTYTQVNSWMLGAKLIIPASVSADGTWTMVFSRSNGYQAMAIWNSTTSVSYITPGIYSKYRDLSGATTTISGPVTVTALPILLETL